jgi:hypothetical protein
VPQQNKKRFCLDTNCLIEAKNRYYAFDILPRFWDLILNACEREILFIPESVYEELKDGYKDEELFEWAKDHKTTLFKPLNEEMFLTVRRISNLVIDRFKIEKANKFLESRDPEIIAFAKHRELILVTQEERVNIEHSIDIDGKYKSKVKIPNICEFLGVEYKNLFDMLRILRKDYNLEL